MLRVSLHVKNYMKRSKLLTGNLSGCQHYEHITITESDSEDKAAFFNILYELQSNNNGAAVFGSNSN